MADWTRDADVPYVGKSGEQITFVDFTPTIDTAAYGANQVLFATAEVANALARSDGKGKIDSLVVIDRDDEGIAFDLYVLDANVALGTINENPSISDDNAASILAVIPVATADYKDLGGAKVACLANLNRLIKAAAGSRSIYLAAMNGAGTPTFTAADDIRLRLGIING